MTVFSQGLHFDSFLVVSGVPLGALLAPRRHPLNPLGGPLGPLGPHFDLPWTPFGAILAPLDLLGTPSASILGPLADFGDFLTQSGTPGDLVGLIFKSLVHQRVLWDWSGGLDWFWPVSHSLAWSGLGWADRV